MAEPTHQCPLCGYRFDASSLTCHAGCPLSGMCNLLCCPNCGYQMPDEDRMGLTGALKRAWQARRTRDVEVTS